MKQLLQLLVTPSKMPLLTRIVKPEQQGHFLYLGVAER
jgi:hypothetical protein